MCSSETEHEAGIFSLEDLTPIEELFPVVPSYEFVYCMQVRATSQHVITQEAPNFFPCKAINPIIVKRKWTVTGTKEIKYSLMPGYVFLFSPERMDPSAFRALDGVLKILQYGFGEYALNAEDERVARWLLKYDGSLGLSRAYRIGDTIKVIDGPLADKLGTIEKMDWRRRRALVRFKFDGSDWTSWLDVDWTTPDSVKYNGLTESY